VGLIKGIGETRKADYQGALRRTQILNYVTKRSAATAQMLGVIALMYRWIPGYGGMGLWARKKEFSQKLPEKQPSLFWPISLEGDSCSLGAEMEEKSETANFTMHQMAPSSWNLPTAPSVSSSPSFVKVKTTPSTLLPQVH
jgi:hypothetical protein